MGTRIGSNPRPACLKVLMILEKVYKPKYALIFLIFLACLSLWQISLIEPIRHDRVQYDHISMYNLNSVRSKYFHPLEQLDPLDYKKLINLTDFHFNLLNECSFPPILLVVIHSAPWNFYRRKCIRETWGQKRPNVAVFFLLGSVQDFDLQRKLKEENRKNHDIVQGSFLDARENLTYKHVMAFKYAIYHCPQAKYILKTDDNVFVNMPTLIQFLTKFLSPYGAHNILFCKEMSKKPVLDDAAGMEWIISFFKTKFYPPHCVGWTLLYSPDIIFILYSAAQKTKYYWKDDVLITGMLTTVTGVYPTTMKNFVLLQENVNDIATQSKSYNKSKYFLFGPEYMSVDDIYMLWKYVKNEPEYMTTPMSYQPQKHFQRIAMK